MNEPLVGIIGAGSWGLALAQHLGRNGVGVKIWGRSFSDSATRKNFWGSTAYLPGIALSKKIEPVGTLEEVLSDVSLLISALPSSVTREVAEKIKPLIPSTISIISTAKGLEQGTNKTVRQILEEVLGKDIDIQLLSGPSFALELANGMPTAVVLASSEKDRKEPSTFHGKAIQVLHRGTLRIYSSSDIIGVELGGILKNIIAFAAGACDGLGLGLNARAALLTRGLKELSTLVEKEGGKSSSVIGLSGLGDLILTATGELSRNRRFGILLGEGYSIEQASQKIGQTIETLYTAEAAYALTKKHNLDSPIIAQAANVLKGETTPSNAFRDLLTREQKEE
jgi:glycerol-3-phosphate dehydrogenase (NAD(P)+)